MKAYISVLNDVICLSEIKKISIVYDNGTNYSNERIQSLFITYKDGKTEEYKTTDYSKAKQDYENLKSELLGIDTNQLTENGAWIPFEQLYQTGYDIPNYKPTHYCSNCKGLGWEFYRRCPHCGAIMVKGSVE